MATFYTLRYIDQNGNQNYFDRREGTQNINERLSLISTTLNGIGANYDQHGEEYIRQYSRQKAIIAMSISIYEEGENGTQVVAGQHTDEYFLTIDLIQTVIQFWDPDNPFDLRVLDRV